MRPMYHARRVKSETERKYFAAELVLASLLYACKRFQSYLLSRSFVVLTSCSLLPHILSSTNLSKCMIRCIVELQEYSFLLENSTRASLADILTYAYLGGRSGE